MDKRGARRVADARSRAAAARRQSGGARAYGSYRREEKRGGNGGMVVVALALVLALVLRFSSGGKLEEWKTKLAGLLEGGADYKDAVSVLGHAMAGEEPEDKEDNALLVFGKKILGIEEEPKPEEPVEPQPDSGQPAMQPQDVHSTDSPDPLPAENNYFEEIDPEGHLTAAGDTSGLFSKGVGRLACESPMPDELRAAAFLFDLPESELEDTTANEPFRIPSPDIVDDTKYELAFPVQKPISGGTVTSAYGYRVHPISGNTTFHHGLDIGLPKGSKIAAFAAGTVSEVGNNATYGNYVKIRHPDGFVSMYAHMSKVSVKKGNTVKIGQKVGEVGSTGLSTGPHLHFELRHNGLILNPNDYLKF